MKKPKNLTLRGKIQEVVGYELGRFNAYFSDYVHLTSDGVKVRHKFKTRDKKGKEFAVRVACFAQERVLDVIEALHREFNRNTTKSAMEAVESWLYDYHSLSRREVTEISPLIGRSIVSHVLSDSEHEIRTPEDISKYEEFKINETVAVLHHAENYVNRWWAYRNFDWNAEPIEREKLLGERYGYVDEEK